MEVFDYCSMVKDPVAPRGARIVEGIYDRGDGVQFRSEGQNAELFSEVVRLSDNAILLASDFVPNAAGAHQQIVKNSDWIHIQFRYVGGGHESVADGPQTELPENSCIISRYRRDSVIDRELFANGRWKHVCLFINARGFSELLDMSAWHFSKTNLWSMLNDDSDFKSRVLPLQPSMLTTGQEMLSCSFDHMSRRIYMRAKSLELLSSVVRALDEEGSPRAPSRIRLSASDLRSILAARDMMSHNLEGRLTLAAIARRVGLSRTKLALGFKAVHGLSVQAYWRDLRLERARATLKTREQCISEIALSVGYSEVSSFTRAFVRRFGYLPSNCRALSASTRRFL
jgi:AraC family transcriptional regulator, transcriptional activator of the genes for pyochelin and ferripyochelin receptors